VAVRLGGRRLRDVGDAADAESGRLALAGYFAAIGFAYLAAEIAAIQQLTMLLGHPVYAVTAVLGVLLTCSGAGSLASDRFATAVARRICVAIAGMLLVLALGLLALVHAAQGSPPALRVAIAVAVLVPVAVLMGGPFPLGLRALARDDTRRTAWAWAANGYASAVAAPLAALIAVEAGSRILFGAAAAAYLAAAATVGRSRASG
jgi:hypothetical protein